MIQIIKMFDSTVKTTVLKGILLINYRVDMDFVCISTCF